MEKDVDCLQCSESFDWNSDETQLDFVALKKAYQDVFELPSHVYESSLIRASMLLAGEYNSLYFLKNLLLRMETVLKLFHGFSETCEMELKVELKDRVTNPEEMEKYVISFLIIFEMPNISSSEYIDKALPRLCKAMACLPYSALARICRIWARYCRRSFKNILEQLHQLITIRTMDSGICNKGHLQDNVDIIAATKVMKVSFMRS